jgi:hypothetical protein
MAETAVEPVTTDQATRIALEPDDDEPERWDV